MKSQIKCIVACVMISITLCFVLPGRMDAKQVSTANTSVAGETDSAESNGYTKFFSCEIKVFLGNSNYSYLLTDFEAYSQYIL